MKRREAKSKGENERYTHLKRVIPGTYMKLIKLNSKKRKRKNLIKN